MTLRSLALVLGAIGVAAAWPPASRLPTPDDGATAQRAAERALVGARRKRNDPDRSAVAGAHRAVAERFPEVPSVAAEALFRAAEVLRADGDSAAASAAFQQVRAIAPEDEFAQRATLELAHLDRRRGAYEEALAGYVRALEEAASMRRADEARYWAGRMCLALGRTHEAVAHLRRTSLHAADPVDRVRAFDAWMTVYLDSDDLEAAAGVWYHALVTLAPVVAERSADGERTRRALERSRSPSRLVELVHERFRARSSRDR